MDTQILENLGFTKGEIKVYFAMLKLGNTSSGQIIIDSGVSRSKVYEILERLKEKGLISESIRENIRYFEAVSPERILDYIKNREKQLREQEEEFRKILPEISAKYKSVRERQEVKIYEGAEGIKTFYNELIDKLVKGDEYLAMTISDQTGINKQIMRIFQNFHLKRGDKGVPAKIIYNIKDKTAQKQFNFTQTGRWQRRISEQDIPTGIAICKDIVATINWGEESKVFVVVCRENAERYRKFFYSLWKKAKGF